MEIKICANCRRILPEDAEHGCMDTSGGSCEAAWTVTRLEKTSSISYTDFYHDFHTAKKFPHQRFGQAFLNALYPEVVDNELFYEESTDRAVEIIFERYVDLSFSFGKGREYNGRSLFIESEE